MGPGGELPVSVAVVPGVGVAVSVGGRVASSPVMAATPAGVRVTCTSGRGLTMFDTSRYHNFVSSDSLPQPTNPSQ